MAEAKRDQNRVTTWLAVNPSGELVNLLIDDATGYLLAKIIAVSSFSSVTPSNILKRDANRVTVKGGVVPSGTVTGLLIDNANGGVRAVNS